MFHTVLLIVWFTCGLIAGLAAYRWFQSENPSYADMDRPKDVGGNRMVHLRAIGASGNDLCRGFPARHQPIS
jgi:hypothetical protein